MTTEQPSDVISDDLLQVLVFSLGQDERYCVDVLKVQEIREYGETITRLPHMDRSVLGILNLRGGILPVIDMRIRFGFAEPVYDRDTVIIVLRVAGDDDTTRVLGLVVDKVHETYQLSPSDVIPPPDMLDNMVDRRYIDGLINLDENLVVMLGVDQLLEEAVNLNQQIRHPDVNSDNS